MSHRIHIVAIRNTHRALCNYNPSTFDIVILSEAKDLLLLLLLLLLLRLRLQLRLPLSFLFAVNCSLFAADKPSMIELTRLNGHRIAVNCDLIRFAESSPDTVLTLVTGEKLLVRETCAEVIEITFAYRVSLLRHAWPDAAHAFTAAFGLPTQHPIAA